MKRFVGGVFLLAAYLFLGACVHLFLYGEPNFLTFGAWAAIVLWPAVLWWFLAKIALVVLAVLIFLVVASSVFA